MRAIPFHFGPPGNELFGWHHPREGRAAWKAAVVLCPPIGYDYMCIYRSWRILAERLAATGFDVCRFDYRGSGDSAGCPEDPDQLAGWLGSISLAVAAAKSRTGAGSVALVGMRLGATLAARAAASVDGVEELVLWDPFRLGKAWVREVRALAQLGHVNDAPVADDLSVAGFTLTGATAADLSTVNLGAIPALPVTRALIIERDDRSLDDRLPAHLRSLGCLVTADRLPGTSDCLVEPMTSAVPEAILDRIVGWLSEGPRAESAVGRARPADAKVRRNGGSEQPIFFGSGQRLFGILTVPEHPDRDAPAVVMLNTGCEYHVGPHRLYVPLARQWANQGHYVFRFDLGGIGDSVEPRAAAPNVAYPPHALHDLRLAIEAVRARTGATRVILIGICAGGWHAYEAARSGLPIDGFVGINAPLYLREGPGYGKQGLREEWDRRRYTRSLTKMAKWKKALRGEASGRTFARLTVRAFWRSVGRHAWGLVRRNQELSLEGELRQIAARGISALFVYSTQDLSHVYFTLNAGTAGTGSHPQIELAVVDEADHTFRPLGAQKQLRAHLDGFLERHRDRSNTRAVRG